MHTKFARKHGFSEFGVLASFQNIVGISGTIERAVSKDHRPQRKARGKAGSRPETRKSAKKARDGKLSSVPNIKWPIGHPFSTG